MSTFKGQHYLDFDAPAPAQRHSPTSIAAAADQTALKINRSHALILGKLLELGPMTDQEIGDATGLDMNNVRPRRVELVRAGMVEQCGEGRTKAGKRAAKWRRAA
jgi:predicted ArsR family transcriptional regulator